MIAAVDEDGLICYQLLDGYLDTESYITFLKMLKRKTNYQEISLFFDGLSVHKTRKAQNFIRNNHWRGILNEAYQSQHNLIEMFFGYVKRIFKRKKLQYGS